MKRGKIILIFCMIFLVSSVCAIPQTFNIHGKVTDSGGTALSGATVMNFSIYDAWTSGNLLWTSDNQTVMVDSDGIYNFILSAIDLNFSEQYYLGVKIESDAEMIPRINLTSSPYAFRAQNVSISGVEFDSNVELGSQNISTTGWFKGLFNWVIGLGSNYLSFNGTTLNFNETFLNLTIDARSNGSGTFVPYTGATSNLVLGANNFSVDSSVLFVDSNNNRVGIGTASPGTNLHVDKIIQDGIPILKLTGIGTYGGPTNSTEGVGIGLIYNDEGNRQFWIGDSASGNGLRIRNNILGGWNYISGVNQDISFEDSSGTQVLKLHDGNVGIGTMSPNAKLDVNGTFNATSNSGSLRVDSNGNVRIGI